jgi:predicted O-methyltransferase YrrM
MPVLHDVRRLARTLRLAASRGPRPIRLARRAIRDFGALQRTWELASLVAMVAERKPRVVVEIGTHRGGTLVCWAAVAPPDALLVSIDLPTPAEGLGTAPDDLAAVRRHLKPGQQLVSITGDSHAPATLERLRAVLDGRPVDFLWIDGDHSDPGVRQDWAMYGGLVRAGGLAALHDIHPNPETPGNQVHPLWAELRRERPGTTRELIDQDQPGGRGCGIGIVYL